VGFFEYALDGGGFGIEGWEGHFSSKLWSLR